MDSEAPYLRIAAEIRDRITRGDLRPGDRVPSTRQITQKWGVAMATATKVIAGAWGDEGSSRVQHAWTADPGLIRTLQTGQACYIHHGGATFVQVARPKPSPLPLPAARTPSVIIPPPSPSPANEQAGPPEPGSLEDVLGPGVFR